MRRFSIAAALILGLAAAACGGKRGSLSPLHVAARNGDAATITALVRAGADPNQLDEHGTGWTPLMHAVHKNQKAAVAALLAAGANADARTAHGTTALMMASGYGQLENVKALLAAGADPHAENHDNLDPLWAAAGYGALVDITDGPPLGSCFPDVVDALLGKAPDLRLKRGFEARLVYWIARKDCKALIDRLWRRG
jgi:ankyrin repeat protein